MRSLFSLYSLSFIIAWLNFFHFLIGIPFLAILSIHAYIFRYIIYFSHTTSTLLISFLPSVNVLSCIYSHPRRFAMPHALPLYIFDGCLCTVQSPSSALPFAAQCALTGHQFAASSRHHAGQQRQRCR